MIKNTHIYTHVFNLNRKHKLLWIKASKTIWKIKWTKHWCTAQTIIIRNMKRYLISTHNFDWPQSMIFVWKLMHYLAQTAPFLFVELLFGFQFDMTFNFSGLMITFQWQNYKWELSLSSTQKKTHFRR